MNANTQEADITPDRTVSEALQRMVESVGLTTARLPNGAFCCEEVTLIAHLYTLITQLYDVLDCSHIEHARLREQLNHLEGDRYCKPMMSGRYASGDR